MSTQGFSQFSETDVLKEVIIGRYEGYCAEEAYVEIVNEDQKKGLPQLQDLEREFEAFKKVLVDRGVKVLTPDYVGKFVYDQLTPRDIGVTIGHKFVMCNMARSSRRYESAGIFSHLQNREGEEPHILLPRPHDALLEGGDIVVDKGKIFIGISQRSSPKGFQFLEDSFPDFDVIPVYCRSISEGENVLHLDCTFNPVGRKHALIYPDGFSEIPAAMREYEWIEVNREEQAALATNVLSLSPDLVISRNHQQCKRVNDAMRKAGIEVVEIEFNGAPATGGSFRCCTLPLVRS